MRYRLLLFTVATSRSLREALMHRRPCLSRSVLRTRTALAALLLVMPLGARVAQAQETIRYYAVDALGSPNASSTTSSSTIDPALP